MARERVRVQPPTTQATPAAKKEYGGWYDNPATGTNQRWWGEGVWTGGEEPMPQSKEEVGPFLNDFQKNLLEIKQAPEVRVDTMEGLQEKLAPAGGPPTLLNRVEKFGEMREEHGVAALEDTLNTLKGEMEEEEAAFRKQRTAERAKPVPMGVIEGRIGEEERAYQERTDYLGRQQARITDQLNTKYNVISTYMNLMSLDYQDAVNQYDKEFTRNMNMYEVILGQEAEARTQFERDRDAAKSNLQIYMNAITAGNLNYASMSTTEKLMVSKLEAQSGLPIGFMSSLKMNPKDRLMAISEDKTQAWMIGEDGNLRIESTGLRAKPSAGTATEREAEKDAYYKNALIEDVGNYAELKDVIKLYSNYLDPDEIYRLYNANSPYGPAKEKSAELGKYGIKTLTELD